MEREEEKLQQLFAERNGIEQQIRGVEAEQRKMIEDQAREPTCFAEELIAMDSWRQFLIRRKATLAASRTACEQKIQAQRLVLVEVRRQLELLLKLETRKKSEWQQEFDREQENMAAELHLARMHSREKR